MSKLDLLTKSLVDVYAQKLNDQQKVELMQALDIIAYDAKYNVFKNTFPAEGKYSIEAYRPFMDAFHATGNYDEVGIIAGNRCVTPWTYIETPEGKLRYEEVLSSKEKCVLSWDGEQGCVAQVFEGILKKPEKAFRIVLDNGEFFDCTRRHRVLTSLGWLHIDRLMSLSSGLSLTRTIEDYEDYCVADGYLCDQRPHLEVSSGQEPLPLRDDVQLPSHLVFSHTDAVERICQYIRDEQGNDHRAIPHVNRRLAGLFEPFSIAKTDTHVLPLTENTLKRHSLVFASAFQIQQAIEQQHGKLFSDAYLELFDSEFLYVLSRLEGLRVRLKNDQQSVSMSCLYRPSPEFLCGDAQAEIFFPLIHPPLIGGKRIVCIVPLYYQPIVDFTIEKTECYKAAGVIHHNTGKSVAGSFITTCHATGIYPEWWTGKKYYKPLLIWCGGDNSITCRDIVQYKLLGEISDIGSGMIPKDLIVETKTRRNVADAIETIRVRHVSGGISTIVIKTYEQGRASWQGTEVDFIWIDEECPEDVYGEAVKRLMTTKGTILLTFTPLNGPTPLVMSFLDNDQFSEAKYPKYVARVSWDDVPHLSAEDIEKELARTPENMRDCRRRGDPTVGSGLIYPLPLEQITVDDFRLPKYFPKAYGMDVGWSATAAIFGAWDRDNDIIYVYSEYKQGQADPIVHAAAIRARGSWLRGAVDPSSRQSGQMDGSKLFEMYTRSVDRGGGGLKLNLAANAVEAGIFEVWTRLQTGRLKIFKSCTQLQKEYALYYRDENGKIKKKNDHLLDSLRYMVMAEKNMWKTPEDAAPRTNVVNMQQYMNACV